MDTTIAWTEIEEQMKHIDGEDRRQEYVTLRLEGLSHDDAVRRSYDGDVLDARHPGRGPLVQDQRPLVSPMESDEWVSMASFTQDDRSMDELEADWALSERKTALWAAMRRDLSAQQYEVLSVLYGFETGVPATRSEAAEILGLPAQRVKVIRDTAMRKLKKNFR